MSEEQEPYLVPSQATIEADPLWRELNASSLDEALSRVQYMRQAATVEPITINLVIQPALGAVYISGSGVSGRIGGLKPCFPGDEMEVLRLQIAALRQTEQQLNEKLLDLLTAKAQPSAQSKQEEPANGRS